MKRKICIAYISGAYRERKVRSGGGGGIHAICIDTIESTRYARVPAQITPVGYVAKLTGAELKNADFDPEYSKFGVSIKAKAGSVVKDGTDITIVDGLVSAGPVSAAESFLVSFIKLFEYMECEHYLIITRSSYLAGGLNKNLKRWEEDEWLKRDGTEINDKELWQQIAAIVKEKGANIEVKLSGERDDVFGNASSDRCAAIAAVGSVNKLVGVKWVTTSVHDTNYWDPEKPIPTLLQQKWSYQLSGSERAATSIDGEVYHHYLLGDHNKSKDDIELLGKMTSDGGFAFVLHKGVSASIDKLVSNHVSKMWAHTCDMYKSSLMVMVNLASVIKPKSCWEIEYSDPDHLLLSGSRNDVSSGYTDELFTKVIRPPKLSFRILDLEEQFKEVVYSYCILAGKKLDELKDFKPRNIRVTDITDKLYERVVNAKGDVTGVKLDVFYSILSTSITLPAKHPYNDKDVKLIFTRGVDLPSRSILAKLDKSNPKISIVTWQFDTIMINYGIIVDCDEGIGLWSGYSSTRILNVDEQ